VKTDDALRASDAERSTTVEILRRHHAEGRLDTAELEDRVERCYAAKTRGDLAALTADLPGPHQRRPRDRRGARLPFAPLVFIAAIIALSVATGVHVFWLVWPLAFFTFARFRTHRGRFLP
jgi:hypothetical protein